MPPQPLNEGRTSRARAVFIVDPQALVRAILYYPLSNGRNMEEVKRLLVAMMPQRPAA